MIESMRSPEYLLERARAGETEAFGELLAQYHNYLRLMARTLLGSTLRIRVDSSDLVQEAFLEAHRDFPSFAGSTERELLAWLRRILARNLADRARYLKAEVRNHRRTQSLGIAPRTSKPFRPGGPRRHRDKSERRRGSPRAGGASG